MHTRTYSYCLAQEPLGRPGSLIDDMTEELLLAETSTFSDSGDKRAVRVSSCGRHPPSHFRSPVFGRVGYCSVHIVYATSRHYIVMHAVCTVIG